MNPTDGNSDKPKLIDLGKVREAKTEEKRRKYERVLFKNLLGVYCVAEEDELRAVELVDVSAEGLSFQLPAHSKNLATFVTGKECIFRFYFSEETFIPVACRVANERHCIENGSTYVRFGCVIDQTLQSYGTYMCFVTFLTKFAQTAQVDDEKQRVRYF